MGLGFLGWFLEFGFQRAIGFQVFRVVFRMATGMVGMGYLFFRRVFKRFR